MTFPKPDLRVLLSCCCVVLCNIVANGQKNVNVQTPSGGPVRPHHVNQNEAAAELEVHTTLSSFHSKRATLWLRTGSSVTQTPRLISSVSMPLPTVLFSHSLTSSHSMHSSLHRHCCCGWHLHSVQSHHQMIHPRLISSVLMSLRSVLFSVSLHTPCIHPDIAAVAGTCLALSNRVNRWQILARTTLT